MLFMSKHRSAPRSDALRNCFARASRSVRSRSMSTRCSQSTDIVPYVRTAMRVSLLSDQRARGLRDELGCGNGDVLERRRERDGDVQRAEPLDRRVERPERLDGDARGDLGGDAVALVTLVDDDRAPGLL